MISTLTSDLSLKKILKYKDIREFSDKTVAYETDRYYFSGRENFHINGNKKVYYGIISDLHYNYGELGFDLSRICLKTSIPSNHALIDSKIKNNGYLQMRLATDEEKLILINALKLGECVIEYKFDKDSWKLIE